MYWCFATINNKLAEIYFERRKGKVEITAHCYVKKEEYKTKREQQWIKEDTAKFQFVYRKKVYRDLNNPDKIIQFTNR